MKHLFPIFALFLLIQAPLANAADPADYAFINLKVDTVNESQPWAEAVAIKDNVIVYVGDSAGTDAFVGEGTETLDLDGKMIVPGFFRGMSI